MNEPKLGALEAIKDLFGAMMPLQLREYEQTVEAQLRRIPTQLNEFGYDPFGLHIDVARWMGIAGSILYHHYFRVETHGIENVPEGRVLLISNHGGQLPFDAIMLRTALLLEANPPRIAREMADNWIPALPFASTVAARVGALVGTPDNCVAMMEAEECVCVFPEGIKGMNKLYKHRYQLMRFGSGFMRLALQTGTPIVPVGIVGAEEQQPAFGNLKGVAKMFGMPAFPVTATFPWLGPLGLLPMPVKYHIHCGEPMHFQGEGNEENRVIQGKVSEVKKAISGLLDEGLKTRAGVFR